MKKVLCGIAASAAASLFIAACSADAGQNAAHPSLRICSTGDYRPFTYRDPNGWSGMDIDLAHDLAKHLDVQLDLVQTTWGTLIGDLGARCDMAMGGITVTPQRAQQALLSAPYLRDGKAAIVRCADVAKFPTLSAIDQPGVRVVVNPDGTNAQFDKSNLHRATVIEYPDNKTIFEQVLNDNADVMITDASEIRWETTRDPHLCGSGVETPFTTEEKAYLIARSDPGLQQRVNDWLGAAQKDGTYARVAQLWLGRVTGP
ncbi:MAG: transporter substrate-binding domain-containing protein [Mycobacterium sp.]